MEAFPKATLKLMIVDDSNIIRRRIERSQQIARWKWSAPRATDARPWRCSAAPARTW
jgi:hypothetical protein